MNGHRIARVASALVAVAGVSLTASCVQAPARPTSAAGTTVVASARFCDPLRELATDAWQPSDRTRAKAELAAARAAAPGGVQPALDRLLALEGEGVHPAAPGASAEDVGAWFDAMNELADVAGRECLVELAMTPTAGSSPPGSDPRPPASARDGVLTFADLVTAVREAGRGATWIDRGLDGVVARGEATQVVVQAVDDPGLALAICEDLVAVAPRGDRATTVRVRNAVGLVVASTDSGSCASDALQP